MTVAIAVDLSSKDNVLCVNKSNEPSYVLWLEKTFRKHFS